MCSMSLSRESLADAAGTRRSGKEVSATGYGRLHPRPEVDCQRRPNHRCPLKPSSPVIAILRRLTPELSHGLLPLQRGIGGTRQEGTGRRERARQAMRCERYLKRCCPRRRSTTSASRSV
jgi:hypothetical protein